MWWRTPLKFQLFAHEVATNSDINADADANVETHQAVVKPHWIDSVAHGRPLYVFQQDSAPSHEALNGQDWMAENFIIISHQTCGLLTIHQTLIL
ncbi:hypothetical protein ACTXT7_001368 [Hymenolepis weldensis]